MMKSILIKKNKENSKYPEGERGIVLYMTLLIVSSIVAMAAALSSIVIGEFKISGDIAKAMYAVNNASSGLELALYKSRIDESLNNGNRINCNSLVSYSITGCSIDVDLGFTANAPCDGAYSCTKIQSTGTNAGFNRKLQAIYLNQ